MQRVARILLLHVCVAALFPDLAVFSVSAQGCQSTIVIVLENNRGGFFPGQKVTLASKVDGKSYQQTSGDRGEATLLVPCNEVFELTISNYTKKVEIESPGAGRQKHTYSYAPDMVQKQKQLAMNDSEQAVVDAAFANLPDTLFLKASVMPPPLKNPDYYAWVVISIRDIGGGPLMNEAVAVTGRRRNKTVKGVTDKTGRLLVYLPKGDTYDINFKYHKNFYSADCEFSKGTMDLKVSFSYLGTREIEKRRKEEQERIARAEKKLKEDLERFEKECTALGLSVEDCYRKEMDKYLKGVIGISDTVVSSVLNRNKWDDKLIVCDVTGSMDPYVAQVALWYRLQLLRGKSLQFVFFNDGDDLPDNRKKIGETGGVHYIRSKAVDSLDRFMSRVQALGTGGDCPENNMEALLKGVKMAAPFKELVMIADNNAPVKDITLLSSFNLPVHIIICGGEGGNVHPDYLKIAWKTKGSIHTVEEDITTLARLSEGQQIVIGGTLYRIMGGEFVEVKKS